MQEIVPNTKTLEGLSVAGVESSEKLLIIRSVESVRGTLGALSHISATNQFYWSFIASCCDCVQLDKEALHKLSSYTFVLEQLSKIFQVYCKDKVVILEDVPEDIACISDENVKDYFKWVIKVQNIFRYWHEKFRVHDFNYEDILAYASSLPTVITLAQCFSSTEFIFEPGVIEVYKKQYSKLYREICLQLVKSHADIPG